MQDPTTYFTQVAVQRAMDERAANWGAPAGYYKVGRRIARVSSTEQVWRVKVNLFGGSIQHPENVVFAKADGKHHKPIKYRDTQERILAKNDLDGLLQPAPSE